MALPDFFPLLKQKCILSCAGENDVHTFQDNLVIDDGYLLWYVLILPIPFSQWFVLILMAAPFNLGLSNFVLFSSTFNFYIRKCS